MAAEAGAAHLRESVQKQQEGAAAALEAVETLAVGVDEAGGHSAADCSANS